MTDDIKKAMVFADPSTEPEPQAAQIELTAQQQFDQRAQFSLAPLAENNAPEQAVEAVLKLKKTPWHWRLLATAGVGLIGWQAVDTIMQAVQAQDWLTLGWSSFVSGIALTGIAALGREFRALSKLKKRQDERSQVQTIISAEGIGKAKPLCQKLAKLAQVELTAGYDKWIHALAATHNDKEVFTLYDQFVLAEQDKKAQQLVAKYASQAALMVALSPLALADMLLVAWRNLRLIEEIADVYGVQLGYWSKIRLLRLVLANMAFAGASEMITDVGIDFFSVDIAGKISARAAQGLGVGLLSARLGLKTISVMRPLPYLGSTPPTLSDIRKKLLLTLSEKRG